MALMSLTPQSALRGRILLTLGRTHSGALPRAEALEALRQRYASDWTPQDLESPSTRPWETKWENRASFERAAMIREDLLQEQMDGVWALTPAGWDAFDALAGEATAIAKAERERRDSLWGEVLAAGGPRNVPAGLLNELRLFRGGRGIYVDAENTRAPLWPDGVAVSFLHNGSTYADEFSAQGVRYHYPRTKIVGRDQAEIAASRSAYRLGLPVFAVTQGDSQGKRNVHRGYIEEYDDQLATVLVTFEEGELPPAPPYESPFQLEEVGDPTATWQKRRARPNQQRFVFHVMQRYGLKCAVCDLSLPSLIHAAHLRAKKDKGADDPRNGLPLCANHHIAFDSGLWSVDAETYEILLREEGPSFDQLRLTRKSLCHLPALPHKDALTYLEAHWQSQKVPTSK